MLPLSFCIEYRTQNSIFRSYWWVYRFVRTPYSVVLPMPWPLPHAWYDDFRIAVTQSTYTDGYWTEWRNESVFIRAFHSNDCLFCLVGTLPLCAPCTMFCEVWPQRYEMYLPNSYRISTITEVPSTELNIQFSYWLAEYLVVIWIQFVVVFTKWKLLLVYTHYT